MHRVLVTGATGFIGSHLIGALSARGHHVLAVTRRDAPRRGSELAIPSIKDTGDVHDLVAAFGRWRPTVCLHLATLMAQDASPADAMRLVESNIAFPARVADAYLRSGGRLFINVSSFMQRREGQRLKAVNAYAATKNAFTVLLEDLAERRGANVVDVQLFDTYGPRDSRPKFWGACAGAAITGKALPASPGEQLVTPTHVNDIVEAVLQLIRVPRASAWIEHHLLGPEVVTLREAVDIFSHAANRPIPIAWGALPYRGGEMFQVWRSGTVPEGWVPRVTMREGFAELWRELNSGVDEQRPREHRDREM